LIRIGDDLVNVDRIFPQSILCVEVERRVKVAKTAGIPFRWLQSDRFIRVCSLESPQNCVVDICIGVALFELGNKLGESMSLTMASSSAVLHNICHDPVTQASEGLLLVIGQRVPARARGYAERSKAYTLARLVLHAEGNAGIGDKSTMFDIWRTSEPPIVHHIGHHEDILKGSFSDPKKTLGYGAGASYSGRRTHGVSTKGLAAWQNSELKAYCG
jgi:hypothetical protein